MLHIKTRPNERPDENENPFFISHLRKNKPAFIYVNTTKYIYTIDLIFT